MRLIEAIFQVLFSISMEIGYWKKESGKRREEIPRAVNVKGSDMGNKKVIQC